MLVEPIRGGWVLLPYPLEAMPVDDLREHSVGVDCWCAPEVDDDDILMHNSLDHREDFETGRRKCS